MPSTFLTTLVLQALAERQRALVMQGRASVRGTAIRELAAELGPGIVLYFQMTKELGFVMLAISCMSIPSLVLALSVRSAAGSPRRANTACTECIAYIILCVYFAHVHTESDAHTLACLHTHGQAHRLILTIVPDRGLGSGVPWISCTLVRSRRGISARLSVAAALARALPPPPSCAVTNGRVEHAAGCCRSADIVAFGSLSVAWDFASKMIQGCNYLGVLIFVVWLVMFRARTRGVVRDAGLRHLTSAGAAVACCPREMFASMRSVPMMFFGAILIDVLCCSGLLQ